MRTLAAQSEARVPEAKPGWAGSAWFDTTSAVLGLITVAGVYLDGWAHNHDQVDQSFLTPWHAVLYASIAASGAFLGITAASNHSRGSAWSHALPSAYRLSVAGVVLFLGAGVLDLGWHALFGLEEDTAALLSPTHLALALAGVLIITGPWRSALNNLPNGLGLSWGNGGPLVLSIAGLIGAIGFMTQFAHPIVDAIASRERDPPEVIANLYVISENGEMQQRLTLDAEAWTGFSDWSPDGTRLVASVRRTPDAGDLFLIDTRSRATEQLTSTRGADYTPSWSPDGKRIAFASNVGDDPNAFESELFVINTDGSGLTRLTNLGRRVWGTTWSPDSRTVAFSARVGRSWQVYSVNADGSDLKQLTRGGGDNVGPDWSPDGRTIAFNLQSDGGRSRIQLIEPDGSGLRTLPGTGDDYHPSWAPSGDRLAFTSFKHNGRGEVYVVGVQGGEPINLTRSAGLNYDNVSWRPDGQAISVTAWVNPGGQDHEVMRRLGISSVLLQTAIFVAPLLLVLRRWSPPFGSLTLIAALTSLGAAVLRDHYVLMPALIIAGLLGDLLLLRLGRPLLSVWGLRLFACVVPATFYALYFLTLQLDSEVDWEVHLWAGSIFIAALAGLGLSYLVVPPGSPDNQPQERPGSV